MAQIEMKPCPFCGERLNDWPTTIIDMKDGCWVISHFCKSMHRSEGGLGVTINVYGNTKEEAINNWNERVEDVN